MADESFARELSDVSIELERVSDLADGVARSLTNAFRGAIVDGRSLRGVLGEVSAAFADIALKAALKPVGMLISNGVETLFNGLNPALAAEAPNVGLAAAARQAQAPAAGGAVNVTFNVSSPDARSFVAGEAEVSAMLPGGQARDAGVVDQQTWPHPHPASPPSPIEGEGHGAAMPVGRTFSLDGRWCPKGG